MDGKHLMHFQSENACFKFLRRVEDDAWYDFKDGFKKQKDIDSNIHLKYFVSGLTVH